MKVLTLRMDSCKRCIRLHRERNATGYFWVCLAKPLEPRVFTEAECDAIRDGDIFLPLWCPLPDDEASESTDSRTA